MLVGCANQKEGNVKDTDSQFLDGEELDTAGCGPRARARPGASPESVTSPWGLEGWGVGVQTGMEGEEWRGFLPVGLGSFALFPVCIKQEEKFFVESVGIAGLKKLGRLKTDNDRGR